MKRTTRIIALILSGLITYSCFPLKKTSGSDQIILPLSDATSIREGSIVYALPRSVLTVVVGMERTIEVPGPYARYAGDLLGLNNVINKENEFWTIEGVSVHSNDELDPSEFYIIESNTLFQTNILTLKREGLILDLNTDLYSSAASRTGLNNMETNDFKSFDLGSDEYFLMQRDTAFKRVNIDSTFIRIPYIVEKKKKLPVDQLAEKAARRLMELRDGKHMILTGETNVFPQNDAAIIEMNRLEKEYTELFTGKTITEKRTFTCQVIPAKEMVGKQVTLFQFSDLTGPVTGNAKGGKPVVIEFIPEKKTKELTMISKPKDKTLSPAYDKLFYRVPDVVNIKISSGAEIILNSRRLIYQFGQVVQLPANYIIGK